MILSLCSRNARPLKALAWANGTPQRARWWAVRKLRAVEPKPSSLLEMTKKGDMREVL